LFSSIFSFLLLEITLIWIWIFVWRWMLGQGGELGSQFFWYHISVGEISTG